MRIDGLIMTHPKQKVNPQNTSHGVFVCQRLSHTGAPRDIRTSSGDHSTLLAGSHQTASHRPRHTPSASKLFLDSKPTPSRDLCAAPPLQPKAAQAVLVPASPERNSGHRRGKTWVDPKWQAVTSKRTQPAGSPDWNAHHVQQAHAARSRASYTLHATPSVKRLGGERSTSTLSTPAVSVITERSAQNTLTENKHRVIRSHPSALNTHPHLKHMGNRFLCWFLLGRQAICMTAYTSTMCLPCFTLSSCDPIRSVLDQLPAC